MSDLSVKALVDAGAHIGCRVGRWNPKMDKYILESRNRIHIIDLKETIKGILRAKHFIREVVAGGNDVLFVGTKQQIRGIASMARDKAGMPYVSDRWIGGTLTNFEVIGSRIAHLEDMEKREEEGRTDVLTKKELARFNREKAKLFRNLHGIREMFRLPGAMVVVDTKTERKAIREAQRMGIPVVGIIDTDCDPTHSDLHIPANDDAIRSVNLIMDHLFEAADAGKTLRKERGVPDPVVTRDLPTDAPVPRPTRVGARRGPGGPGRGGRGGPPRGGGDGRDGQRDPATGGGDTGGDSGQPAADGGTPRPGLRVPMPGGVNRPVEIQPHPENEEKPKASTPDEGAPDTAKAEAPDTAKAEAPDTPEAETSEAPKSETAE